MELKILKTFILNFARLSTAVFIFSGCAIKNPEPGSVTTGDSTGTTSGPPKNVRISWTASHAIDVGLTGGGYKVYVRKGSLPTAINTIPVIVANPGNGTHVTNTIMSLTPGQYYILVASYSTNGDSPMSATYSTVVP